MSKKKFTYEFIKNQIENEKGYFLLSNEYIDSKTKLEIKCPNNHEFKISYSHFSKGIRCRKCFDDRNRLSYDFIKEQIEKEGYELLSEEYVSSREKLSIKCTNGHEYDASFDSFKDGRRCPICAGVKKHSYEFIKEQFENEGYKLLSKEYKNSNKILKTICPNGHEYKVRYSAFKTGNRCSECRKHQYKDVKENIEKEGYKLLSKEYKNVSEKLKVRCPKNHEYEVSYHNFRIGQRCPHCLKNSYSDVKENIEKEGYKLLSTEYIPNKKLKVVCDKGHEYEVKYCNFFNNESRCPKCNPSISKQEKEILEYIKSLNIDVIENCRDLIKNPETNYHCELDIVIPEKKIAIEYCGVHWHSEIYKDKKYHLNKLEQCNKEGYRLITIFEDEWLYKNDIVKNRLKYILGLEENKIYARKCKIKEIDTKEATEFINKHHIQGYSNCKVKLGAFYNNKLVSVMTFSNASRRGNKKEIGNYELNRFCTSYNVVGIASKLLKYFQRTYEYNKIITFADRRWSDGNLYEKIGFKKLYNVDLNYFYTNGNNRVHRFNFRKGVLKDKLKNFNPMLSEHQNMINNNWFRIYDCGNIKYEIINNNKYYK
jgi:hypothetical protein